MWIGLLIFCMFFLIPIAIIAIPALLTKKENDLSFVSGSMTTSSRVIRFVSTLVFGVISLGCVLTGNVLFSTYSIAWTICVYCMQTANGYADKYYAEAAKWHSQVLIVTSAIILGVSPILMLYFSFLSDQADTDYLKFSAPLLMAYSFIYKDRRSLTQWLTWVFAKRS